MPHAASPGSPSKSGEAPKTQKTEQKPKIIKNMQKTRVFKPKVADAAVKRT
jgi:hypothetical protein